MTIAVEEVKIDSTTGLPELPEGMFWRVGTQPAIKERYYSRSAQDGVFLMQQGVEPKTIETPVYRKRWWGGKTLSHVDVETVMVPCEESIRFETFDGFFAKSRTEVPKFGTGIRNLWPEEEAHSEDKDVVVFNVTICEEGVAWVAERIWQDYQADQKTARDEADRVKREAEAKERLFGDYPPKTLVGA